MTKLENLLVELSKELTYSPGDFGAKVEGGKLLLPEGVYNQVTDFGTYFRAEDILGMLQTFPSYKNLIAQELGWDIELVNMACEKLGDLLRPYVDDIYFKKSEPKKMVYGVTESPEHKQVFGETKEHIDNQKKN